MHTINAMLNKSVCALALGFAILACCASPIWAQTEETGEGGYQRVSSVKNEGFTINYSNGGEETGEGGYQRADTTKSEGLRGYQPNGGEETGEGGYQRFGETAFSIDGSVEQPNQPALLGNYPNPFNPETTLRFEVRAAQHVRLSVFNALGQRVQMLVDGWVEAGAHEARFDGYDLPSGTYFSRLVTEAGVVTRTMVLAK